MFYNDLNKTRSDMDTRKKIEEILLTDYGCFDDFTVDKLCDLFNVRLSLFQKNRLDLLNWAKSELKQETNPKLGKTMTLYRGDKIIFLRRIIDWINNEA